MPWFSLEAPALTDGQIRKAVIRLLAEARTRINPDLRRVLLLPPDLTRTHSGAGRITEILYQALPEADSHATPL